MTNTTLKISPIKAREIALCEAGLDRAEFTCQLVEGKAADSCYELRFSTVFMDYVCYVSTESGEVLGFDCWPVAA